MEPFLSFDGVWKRFRRGQIHDSLRDLVPALARRILRRQSPELGERDFWALRELSFDVRAGEVLGIIGPNGAGKSTTLKILNHLMDPTKGEVRTNGKISSLIEVSAGFHQDLTGRQNVFLQGAIMGMRKAEIMRKFDQIVDFAGISEFIDTPVKRYSSGMNARLGFSIAAHLEPDVLIIDEVLAVGDHAFQQRAFSKIKSIATSGVPVVLVSHQLDRIAELCTKAILLEKGAVKTSGTAMHCINTYLHPKVTEQSAEERAHIGFLFDPIIPLTEPAVLSGEKVRIRVSGESTKSSYPAGWHLACRVIHSGSGADVHSLLASNRNIEMPLQRKFEYEIELQMNVAAGNYYIELVIWDMDHNEHALIGPRTYVEVLESAKFGGTMQLNSKWERVGSSANSDRDSVRQLPAPPDRAESDDGPDAPRGSERLAVRASA